MSDDIMFTSADIDALNFLNSGDLVAFSEVLRGTERIHPEVRLLLAEMIDPNSKTEPGLVIKRRRAGRPTEEKYVRDMRIGMDVERRMAAYGRGSYDAAIKEVSAEAKLSMSSVRDAYSLWLEIRERLGPED